MRGRDIKRNSYEFADLRLIATFPSKKYNIDDYPAVRNYLEGFKPKLKQTGEKLTKVEIDQVILHAKNNNLEINHNDLEKSRKKTSNKWFETQDSISYWDDFNRQKIIFPAIMSGGAFFAHEEEGFMVVAPGNIITGKNITALSSFLPSNLCYYALRTFYMGGGIEGELKVNRLQLLPIPLNVDNREYNEKEIYDIYELSDEEINFISSSLNSNEE